jgi:hypothetical protein
LLFSDVQVSFFLSFDLTVPYPPLVKQAIPDPMSVFDAVGATGITRFYVRCSMNAMG